MIKLSLLVTIVSLLLLDSIHSVWSTEMINNNNVTEKKLLDQLEYCILNHSVIQKKTGDGLLIIVNDTGGWLLVTNGSNLFVFPSNGPNCEDDAYNPDIVIYALQTSIYAVIFLVTNCIIVLHLYIKELRTVFGILTIIFCFFFNMDSVVTFVHNRYQFTHKINDAGVVCAALVFSRGILSLLYQFTRLTILFHFAYLMYNTYRVRSGKFSRNNKLILKYVTFIISTTVIYSAIAISYDLAVTRSASNTDNGYCTTEFYNKDGSFILFVAQLASVLVMQVVVFVIGMILYYLVNEKCCAFRSINTRVCLTLGSTPGLNAFLFLGMKLSDCSTNVAFLGTSIGTCIQMSILLIIFLTSAKVKTAISQHNSAS